MGSLGIVEVVGVVSAMLTVDTMTKASNVKLETLEKKLGGRLVTIIVSGNISDVKTAVEVGNETANKITKCVAKAVISRPHEEVINIIKKSKQKYKGL
ncbi:BMC domain-containing protein [Clostridium sp. Ade.TY]|uniref:BMC domain-containing protein n=1 Tax=Clostridium sp. Ade.TY TaxID=1391647 RepID=UPI000465B089|nr:BMC domain-containing protein [Clostridium sp. Ade.TY]